MFCNVPAVDLTANSSRRFYHLATVCGQMQLAVKSFLHANWLCLLNKLYQLNLKRMGKKRKKKEEDLKGGYCLVCAQPSWAFRAAAKTPLQPNPAPGAWADPVGGARVLPAAAGCILPSLPFLPWARGWRGAGSSAPRQDSPVAGFSPRLATKRRVPDAKAASEIGEYRFSWWYAACRYRIGEKWKGY